MFISTLDKYKEVVIAHTWNTSSEFYNFTIGNEYLLLGRNDDINSTVVVKNDFHISFTFSQNEKDHNYWRKFFKLKSDIRNEKIDKILI